MSTASAARSVALEPEDEGRLQLYALLARLFAAGPDEGLLRAVAQSAGSVEGDGRPVLNARRVGGHAELGAEGGAGAGVTLAEDAVA